MQKQGADLSNWVRLALSPGVGPATMLKLIRAFGSVEKILEQDSHILMGVVSKGIAQSIVSNHNAEIVDKSLDWQVKHPEQRTLLTLEHELYPQDLAEISSPPMLLFAEGNLDLLKANKVAIVGTRHPTPQGIENSRMFAKELSDLGVCIVSGLAAGVDRYAHEGALLGKSSTIAVIGTGIDLQYPASNRDLHKQIATGGLILSEFPLGMRPLSQNFPRRNRVIVGLSKACLVVESAIDGGSMISAGFALEMGRDVMAIPGSIHNQMARGCHKLLKQGAKLIETVQDVVEELRFGNSVASEEKQFASTINDPVLEVMGFDPVSLDNICAKLNSDFGELCGKLLELELAGHIVNCGGGRYQRIFK